jgi:hypothetical protein
MHALTCNARLIRRAASHLLHLQLLRSMCCVRCSCSMPCDCKAAAGSCKSCWKYALALNRSLISIHRHLITISAYHAQTVTVLEMRVCTLGYVLLLLASRLPQYDALLIHQESYPEARRLVDSGEMIPDQMVCDLLLEALLLDEPGLQDDLGFVVDGFPRTATQVRALVLCLSVCRCDVPLLFWCCLNKSKQEGSRWVCRS